MRHLNERIALCTVLCGFFVVMLDTTIVNVSLPYIGKDLGGTTSSLQWVVDSYTLSFAALLLTSGTACDRLGALHVYLAGLATFAIFSFLCALSTSMWALIIFRAFQGIGAAMVIPSSLALIADMYSDQARRTKIIGLWGAAGGIAAALGPIVGGMLVSALRWNAAFWINIPIIAILIVLVIVFVPPRKPDNNKYFDLWGQVTSIIGLSALTYVVITWGERGWSPLYIIWLIGGIMLVLCFFIIESATPDPMLPLALFKERRFRIALFVGFCLNFSFFGQLFILSLYFQDFLGWSPWLAGLALAPQATSAIIASPLGGRCAAAYGTYPAMLAGLLVGAGGFSSLMFVSPETPYPVIALLTFCVGFGMAFAMPAATSAAVNASPPAHVGVAGGVINTARQIGSVFGVAALGAFITSGSFLTGFHVAVLIAGGVFALAAAIVLGSMLRPRRPPLDTATFGDGVD